MIEKNPPTTLKSQSLSLFFGGLLPIVAFTVIEDQYGPVWGTIAGMVFGVGEILFEIIRYKKVSLITWIGNGMILALGALSIFTNEGIWFKLQPAIFEAFFTVFLWTSLILKKNFLLLMAEKQGQKIPDILKDKMNGMSFRLGLFFLAHAIIATWAALHWSTAAWAWLKGAGVTISMIVYLVIEGFVLRFRLKNQIKNLQATETQNKIGESAQTFPNSKS